MCASRAFEYVLLIVAACPPIGTAAQTDVARIPHAPAFVTLNIAIHPGWNVEFRCNHDGQELTCIISQLKHGEEEQYPELLFDRGTSRAPNGKRGSGGCIRRTTCVKAMANSTSTPVTGHFSVRNESVAGGLITFH